jgi:hypothetical protein
MTPRRFPPPWTVIEHAESFWVRDAGGQTVGWFYFRHNEETAREAKVLTRDEARRMPLLVKAGRGRLEEVALGVRSGHCDTAPQRSPVASNLALNVKYLARCSKTHATWRAY